MDLSSQAVSVQGVAAQCTAKKEWVMKNGALSGEREPILAGYAGNVPGIDDDCGTPVWGLAWGS